jgi:hypothetical protein
MPTMRLSCPHCAHVLEYSRTAPRFCSNCGVALNAPVSPADAPTEPPLPLHAQPTVAYAVRPRGVGQPDSVGGYRLLRELGGGGMGTVYEAEQIANGRRVALKLIRPEFADSPDTVERFRREGRLASALMHPRCVFVVAADEEAGRPYIVMELMPGQNLLDVVERHGTLSVREAVAKILDVIDGLQEAHRQGVIHRDVKPSNCFLDEDGGVKVGDFGLAKSLLGPEHLTRSGSFLGTVLFASPEQIRNEGVNHQADIYSVCATLFYLLTSRAPFQDSDAAAALARTVSDPAPSMRQFRKDIPKTLDEVVLKGLARSRKQRWQSLEELRLALLPFLDPDRVTADLGWRVSAYLLDLLVLIPLVLGLYAGVRALLPPMARNGLGAELVSLGVSLFCGLLYFAVPEWLLGGSPGKLVTRLRVRDAATGDRPSLPRALLRTGCFYLFKDSTRLVVKVALLALGALITQEGDVSITARVVVTTILVAILPFLSSGLGFALLATTMRRRNGYRGVHELLSGTRVIRLPAERPRFRAKALAGWSNPAGSLPPDVPERIGGFRVLAVARATADERLLQGEDAALHRPVWLWQRREPANTLSRARREAARDARPYWLAGGWEDGWSWDVFVAAAGAPLVDAVAKDGRLGWPDALAVLEPLAEELEEAAKDGTLPDRLSPEQVWVQASGRVLLLDAPPHDPTPAETPLDLLRQAAAVALEGRPRAAAELRLPIRAPVPGYASELLARLMGAEEPFAGVAEVRQALGAAHELPVEISQPQRGLQVAASLLAQLPGMLWMFGVGPAILTVAYLICVLGEATGQFSLEAGDDPVRVERDLELLSRDRRAVLAASSWFMTRNLPEFEERLQRAYGERLRQYVEEGEPDEDARGLDYVLAHGDDATAGPSWLASEALHEWWLVEAMLFWPLLWAVGAGLTRGGLSPRLAGIALVGEDGRPAARWRCALRPLVVWLPVVLLLLASLYLDVWRVASARHGWSADAVRVNAWVSWHLWWGAALLVGAGVFTAVCWPNRGPQDRLTGVYPVPR